MGRSVHLARKNTVSASVNGVTTIVMVALTLLVIASLLGAVPSFHRALGISSTDALDEGVLVPKMSTSAMSVTTVFGVLALASITAASTPRMPHDANVVSAYIRALVRPRAIVSSRRRIRRVALTDDDADHYHAPIFTTPALWSASYSAQPEGFSVYTFRTAPCDEKGLSIQS